MFQIRNEEVACANWTGGLSLALAHSLASLVRLASCRRTVTGKQSGMHTHAYKSHAQGSSFAWHKHTCWGISFLKLKDFLGPTQLHLVPRSRVHWKLTVSHLAYLCTVPYYTVLHCTVTFSRAFSLSEEYSSPSLL